MISDLNSIHGSNVVAELGRRECRRWQEGCSHESENKNAKGNDERFEFIMLHMHIPTRAPELTNTRAEKST